MSLCELLDQGLPPSQLMNALLDASPLSDNVLEAVINKQDEILPDPALFKAVMIANSPLAVDVLEDVIDMDPPLLGVDLAQILAAQ